MGSLGEGSGALKYTAPACSPGPPSTPAGLRLEGLEGPGEKAAICLLPNCPLLEDNHLPDLWPNLGLPPAALVVS